MPNFLIVGAAKSGTTALHQYFQQHPEIYMTPSKETNFFAFEGKSLQFQGPGDEAINSFSITTLDQYKAEFRGVTTEKAIGEACPLYLYHPQAAERISQYLPKVKIIVILRHPVERAHANFLHLVRDGREKEHTFSTALLQENTRTKALWEWFWHYSNVGLYGQQLQRYYDRFDSAQIQVFLYEDFRTHPLETMQQIFQFIGVESTFVPDMTERPNKSGVPQNTFLHNLLTRPNPIKTVMKPLFPKKMRQKLQHKNLSTPIIEPDIYKSLLDCYSNDIQHCQTLIERDLSPWLLTN